MWSFLVLLCMCVAVRAHDRVVGGREAKIKEFPYTVSIEFRDRHIATAVLVRPDIVLTSAESVHEYRPSYITVRAGSTTCSDSEGVTSEGDTVGVANIIVHPDFKMFNVDYNVAVLHLNRTFFLGPKTRPIPLVARNNPQSEFDIATLTGWGSNGYIPERLSPVLRTVDLPKVDFDECKSQWRFLTPRSMCYGSNTSGKDLSVGDYGGPLVADKKLVGIASRGAMTANSKKPGIYVDVSQAEIHDFITKHFHNPHSRMA